MTRSKRGQSRSLPSPLATWRDTNLLLCCRHYRDAVTRRAAFLLRPTDLREGHWPEVVQAQRHRLLSLLLRGSRALLVESLQFGKPKDVRLEVAGSVSNIVAIQLYESLGFRWTDASCAEMLLSAEQARAAAEAYEREALSRPAGRGPPSSAASAATTAVAAAWATSDIASIADVVSPFPSRSPSRATLVEDAGEQPGQGGGDR